MKKVSGLFVIIAVLLSACSIALAAKRGMVIEDMFNLESVSSAVVSPDGELIAYTLNRPRHPVKDDNGSDFKELFVIDKNSQSTLYLSKSIIFSAVAFTPDGTALTYLSKRKDNDDSKKSLYKISLSGGESQKVIEFESSISEYAYSPMGNIVAFLAKDTLSNKRKKYQDKGFTQEVVEEDYTNNCLWIYHPELDEKPKKIAIDGHPTKLKWSPDGTYISVTIAPTSLIDDSYTCRKLTVIKPKTGEIVVQFESVGKLGRIAWSQDSKNLAVIKGINRNDPSAGSLYLANLEDGKYEKIIDDFDGHIYYIDLLDGNKLLYLANVHLTTQLGTVTLDSRERKVLLTDDNLIYSRMNLSSNKKVVSLLADSWNHPRELYRYDFKTDPVKLTNGNKWLDEIDVAKQEAVIFYARDSLLIEGILIHPLNEESGKKYPLILAVHGGPESNHTNGWLTYYSYPGQIAAASGYAVFYTNYRGSTGRGVAFSKLGQADYAGGEFDDLVDAVEYLVSSGLVDRDKVGITGRSYGGYASAWGATGLSEHFAASVMGVGVSDLISKFGTTDIPQEMLDVHALKTPWENWQWYLERSPIYHAQGSTTPILIIHNNSDTRVHPSQSMELYRYMKYLSKAPVRMVLYKNEKHGSSKAATKYDYTLRLMRWMDHYLKGDGGEPPVYEIEYPMMENEE